MRSRLVGRWQDARNSDSVKVALVEPYYGGSHKMWADGYVKASTHDVRLFSHDARFWKWRMHGAFLTLSEQLAEDAVANGPPDVILASSMMDVAAFAGAMRHSAPGVPIAVYFHESQFTYPLSPADKSDLTYPMKNWVSAVVADLVIFNSEYHRSLFHSEVRRFLNVFPEDKHVHRIDDVMGAAVVLPVGIDLEGLVAADRIETAPPLIVWNHRWEHDKGPEELALIVRGLLDRGVDFRMAMCGEVFVSVPDEFSAVTQLLGHRLVHEGWATRDRYQALLSEATVAISTAQQEFFGIGVVEAIAAGAHPVLPDRLVYPERVAALEGQSSSVLYSSPDHAVDLVVAALSGPPSTLRGATMQYDWSAVAPQY
ncbi:MAG: tRNA-queuosine alpha-mannosyltransferase domain-containing protein, partial [Acidimicrobiia bacterium]